MATLYDAAFPNPAVDPNVDGCLVYIGGDTPHVWTDAEIAAGHGRYRVPVYVRSNPQNADPIGDAGQAIAWLDAHSVPKGVVVVLDLETAVDPAYVLAFGNRLHQAGYLVWPYGSKSTLFKNPALDGYFVADYTQVEHQFNGTVMTQWSDANSNYDLEDTTVLSALWDYSPPALASTPTTFTGENMALRDDQTGGVWVLLPDGGIFNYDGAPYLGCCSNATINPDKHPAYGIVPFNDSSGLGYEIILDFGDRGDGHSADGGDRFRRYRFPRNGAEKAV